MATVDGAIANEPAPAGSPRVSDMNLAQLTGLTAPTIVRFGHGCKVAGARMAEGGAGVAR